MSVYDALQRVRHGSREAMPSPQSPPPTLPPSDAREAARLSAGTREPGPIAVALTPLLAAVRPLLDAERGAVIQIVAATEGEGASTVAREFALLAGTSGHRRTLLVDADPRDPATARMFGCDTGPGLIDWLRNEAATDNILRTVPDTLLSVVRLTDRRNGLGADSETLREVYDALRGHFDLTVIDCPAVASGGYSNLLPEAADGVILVIAAEATRPAVVTHAKTQIELTGANLLGAVLNRRSNYIPEFLYRML
ncbi:MAG TPA: CpsD/CapB family tyrosine-protein kinase [Stellaceae bacterium]|nr:CpsD/CapB family tyrosine-protein kinase [Stellaceae bacterium]